MKKYPLILIGLLALGSCYKNYGTVEHVEATITDKERISETDGARYLVWAQTPDGPEVFENTDSWAWFKFNSADVQGLMPDQATCTFKVNGWRIRFLSMNRNILDAECALPAATVDPDQG